MEVILLQRLEKYVVQQLGPDFTNKVSQVCVLVMQFVEKLGLSQALASEEKKILSLTWLKHLIPSLSESDLATISDWMERIIEATKGVFSLNSSQASATSVPAAPAAQASAASTASVAPLPTPAVKPKRMFSLKKSVPGSCLDPSTS